MQVLVTGCGRSGTNLVAALVRSFPESIFSNEGEDRRLFKRGVLSPDYGAKLAYENDGYTRANVEQLMEDNPGLKIIICLRHPYDIALSKIVRGQPKGSPNTDSEVNEVSPDSTLEGAVKAVRFGYELYHFYTQFWRSRVLIVCMESVIEQLDVEMRRIKFFLGFKQAPKLDEFLKHDVNKFHKKRYGNKLHKDQIGMFNRFDKIYDGYYKDKPAYLRFIVDELEDVAINWDYNAEVI